MPRRGAPKFVRDKVGGDIANGVVVGFSGLVIMVQEDRVNLFDTGLGTSSIFKQHAFQLGCSRNHVFRGRGVLEGARWREGVERCGLPWQVFLKGTQILPTNQFRGLLQL